MLRSPCVIPFSTRYIEGEAESSFASLPLVATLGFEMNILEKKPQDLE
jgi:hypothetical protein